MKRLLRGFARQIVNFTKAVACDTFGDTASLSAGPCGRCVGRALEDLPMETTTTFTEGMPTVTA